jgi:ABC-type Fe3+/spermidine/putrescine transport system ATPase subunit
MLEVREIYKTYEGKLLLEGVSFTVSAAETVCLLGPSGSGKSTLLRIIAGLEAPEQGQVLWDGKDLASTPAHLRDFGLVFQDYALFPHLTVAENVGFGLKMRGLPREEIQPRVVEALRMVDLDGFEGRRVTELSGGEQQRVALARALAPRPRLLMFDEPLGALDRALKDEVLSELRLILHSTQVPAIYVTHDQEEAFTLADRLLLLHEGRIVQEGPPAEIWRAPVSAWAARFLGVGNVIEGTIASRDGGLVLRTPFGETSLPCAGHHVEGEKVSLLLRALAGREAAAGQPGNVILVVNAPVRDVVFQREGFHVELEGGLALERAEAPQPGAMLAVPFAVECLDHGG